MTTQPSTSGINRVGVFIDTSAMGGAEFLVLTLCRLLQSSGIQPLLLHFDHSELAERLKNEGIDNRIVPEKDLYKSIKTLPLFCYHFRKFIHTLDLDLLHSHLYGPVTAAGLALWKSEVPHVGTMHDTYIVDERPIRIRLLQGASLMGTRVIAVSSMMEQRFRQLARFPANGLVTIRNGVEQIAPLTSKERGELRSSLNIQPEQTAFICVGRLVPVKRHTTLLKALAELPDRHRMKLLIVGTGPEMDSLKHQADALGIAEQVSFLGFRNDIPQLLGASDCFVLASQSEGLSCSITEAMAAGLPVIACDTGGNPELVAADKTGFLIEVDDFKSLAEKFELLAGDAALRKRLGQAGKKFTQEELSLQRMYYDYLSLYGELCRQQP